MIRATAIQETTPARMVVADTERSGARAAIYGVLSHLFFAAPAPSLLQHITASPDIILDDASGLAAAWRDLCGAAGTADADAVRGEFDTVFVSTGKPPVSLYASSYMAGRLRGQLLAELRDDLARLGYARAEDSTEYEDHFSALCDVMRGLIVDGGSPDEAFAAQQEFFRHYLQPWHGRLAAAIHATDLTVFYRPVATFADAYFKNETDYFDLA